MCMIDDGVSTSAGGLAGAEISSVCLLMMLFVKFVGVEKSEVVSWVSEAIEKLESSLLALMGVAQLKEKALCKSKGNSVRLII